MISMRCKCGRMIAQTTDTFPDCAGCEDCGTTYATRPDQHKPLQPHTWGKRFNPSTGEADGVMCKKCLKRDKAMPHSEVGITGTEA